MEGRGRKCDRTDSVRISMRPAGREIHQRNADRDVEAQAEVAGLTAAKIFYESGSSVRTKTDTGG